MLNPYIIIAAIAALTISYGAGYFKGRSDVSDKLRIEQLVQQVKTFEEERVREEAARRVDAIQAKLDREDTDLQNLQIRKLEDALEDPNGTVFSPRDADGLRQLINGKK